MPVFKKGNKEVQTVDSKHTEFLRRFKEEEDVIIPAIGLEIHALKLKLKERLPLEEHLTIKDVIRQNRRRIKSMEEARYTYFLDNNHHIFGYFEEKKNITCVFR